MQIKQTLQTMQNNQHHRQAKINLIHDFTHKMEAFPVRTKSISYVQYLLGQILYQANEYPLSM